MKTPRSQIAPVLAGLTLKSGANAEQLSREVAAYLLDENRTGELNSLMRDVAAVRASEGIVEVTAVSAHELSDKVRQDVERLVREQFKSAKEVIINQRIDEALIGGVRLELIDRQLDLTIRNKLNRFKGLTTTERTAA
jgi:F0F1-type ATP synthase delta subunit